MPFRIRVNIVREKILFGSCKGGLPFSPKIEICVVFIVVAKSTATDSSTEVIVGGAGIGIGIAVSRLGRAVIIVTLGLGLFSNEKPRIMTQEFWSATAVAGNLHVGG